MPRTNIAAQVLKHLHTTPNPAANAIDVTETAADVANKQSTAAVGRQILLAHNTHATTAYTITVTSVADAYGRSTDMGPYTIQAGEVAAVVIPLDGYVQTDGKIYYEANDANIKFAMLQLP